MQSAGICAAIKTAQLPSLTAKSDITWNTYGLYAWSRYIFPYLTVVISIDMLSSSSEIFLIIVCGCVPTLIPLWDKIRQGRTLTPRTSRYPLKGSRSQFVKSKLSSKKKDWSGNSDETDDVEFGNLTRATRPPSL